MVRSIVMMTLGLLIFAGTAQAGEVLLGASSSTSASGDMYFDTYPGTYCGVKQIRIEKDGAPYGGLVYYSFQPTAPWIFSAKAQANEGWNTVPEIKGMGCLQRVRVYVPSEYPPIPHNEPVQTYFFSVYGSN